MRAWSAGRVRVHRRGRGGGLIVVPTPIAVRSFALASGLRLTAFRNAMTRLCPSSASARSVAVAVFCAPSAAPPLDATKLNDVRLQRRGHLFADPRRQHCPVLVQQTISRRLGPPKRVVPIPPWFHPSHRSLLV
jgi:hypothetical protein